MARCVSAAGARGDRAELVDRRSRGSRRPRAPLLPRVQARWRARVVGRRPARDVVLVCARVDATTRHRDRGGSSHSERSGGADVDPAGSQASIPRATRDPARVDRDLAEAGARLHPSAQYHSRADRSLANRLRGRWQTSRSDLLPVRGSLSSSFVVCSHVRRNDSPLPDSEVGRKS